LTRLYFSGEVTDHGECRLGAVQAHHVLHVLRLTTGAAVTLFDGRGSEYSATITRAGKNGIVLIAGDRREVSRESPLVVTLAQGLSSGERMDYTVQKAVELGVSTIQPLLTSRSVVRLAGERAEKRAAHWHGVAIAACEQCGRNIVPEINSLRNIVGWMGAPGSGLRLLLSPRATVRLGDIPAPRSGVILLAGPEGGLSPDEEAAAQVAGFAAVKLGPRVLRTETAAVATLAAMQTLWGDF
jgi:16S rRNA (uracil1498-N3)-methyltransferase